MTTLLLLVGLFLPLQTSPGSAFAEPSQALVLHAGPGMNQPGVLEVEPGRVLSIGDRRGAFVEVFVADGFPVYLHSDYVTRDDDSLTVVPGPSRLNARLLPSTVGMMPVGQVGAADGPLELLDVEGAWVRVRAPLTLPLFAPADALNDLSVAAANSAWSRELAQRDARLAGRVMLAASERPGWLADLHARHELEFLAERALPGLDQDELTTLAGRLDGLGERASSDETRAALELFVAAVADEQLRRVEASAAQSRADAHAATAARSRTREARALAAGLRFVGTGDPVTITGRVTRLATNEADLHVYSIRDTRGRTFKLSAAEDIADLSQLADHEVTLRGRSLTIVTVNGPVLVVDQVTDVRS